MSVKSCSLALFFFTAITLAHAAFIDYRSATTDGQRNQDKMSATNSMLYLQTRKFGVEQLSHYYVSAGGWRGITRSKWTENGLCRDVFDLLIKMKGGKTRIALLSLLAVPKNKLQLSYDLDITWKAVDSHVEKLLFYGLMAEVAVAGTCRVYAMTEKGKNALALAERYQRQEMFEETGGG